MRLVVAPVDGGHAGQVGLVADGGQAAHGGADGAGEVRGVHRLGDVEAARLQEMSFHVAKVRSSLSSSGLGDLGRISEHRLDMTTLPLMGLAC